LSGVGTAAINRHVSALRCFFRVTLKRYAIVEHTHFIHEPRKLPVVLSPQEVARLLDAAPGLKYKTALSVAYGAGLRAFDLLELDGKDLRREPLERRKVLLMRLLARARIGLEINDHIAEAGDVVFRQAWLRRHRLEAARLALHLWPFAHLAQVQEPNGAGGEAGSGRGLGQK